MSQTRLPHVPTFRQILRIDPFIFLCALFGCGGGLVFVLVFLSLHFSGPEAWLETAGDPVSIPDLVGIILLLALLPLVATMPFVFRRMSNIRSMLKTSEQVPGKIQFVKESFGFILSVLLTYQDREAEQIRRVSVRKRRTTQQILRTGQEIRVLVDHRDPRRVLIKEVLDLALAERR